MNNRSYSASTPTRSHSSDGPTIQVAHAYDARIAADTRAKRIEAGLWFIAETVFSHPSKLELIRSARDAGF